MTKEWLNRKLADAIYDGNYIQVKKYIGMGADVNNKIANNTPVIMKALSVYPEIIPYLLEKGANPLVKNIYNHTFFDYVYMEIKQYNGKERFRVLYEYDCQKIMIEKFPDTLYYLYKLTILNEKIKEENIELINCYDLNLL